MTVFKKFTGNYKKVIDVLGLPKAFYESQASLVDYEEQLDKDFSRTAYVSDTFTVEQMKSALRKTDHLKGIYSYAQGNFDAGVFGEVHPRLSPAYQESIELSIAEGTSSNAFDSIRFAYIDDVGRNCAFSLSYIRKDPNIAKGEQFIDIEKRKYQFAVAIIKDINFAPVDRTITYISHPGFVSEKIAKMGENLVDHSVPQDINKILNSKYISTLLDGVFDGDSISIKHFEKLKKRILPGNNIDSRDFKIEQFNSFLNLAQKNLAFDRELQGYISEVIQKSQKDYNFFKEGNYDKTLIGVFDKINVHINQVKNKDQTASLILENKLNLLSTQLELRAHNCTDESHAVLKSQLYEKAKDLRNLIIHPSDEAKKYQSIEFAELNAQLEAKASKINQLRELVRVAKNKLGHEKISIAYLNNLQNKALQDPEFFMEEHYKNKIALISKAINIYVGKAVEEAEKELVKHLESLASEMEQYADSKKGLIETSLIQGLLDKAKQIRTLKNTPSIKAAKDFKDITIKDLVSSTMKAILTKRKVTDTQQVKNKLPQKPEHYDENVVQRNSTAIIIGVLALVVAVSIILLITGVFAPLGLVLATGLTYGLAYAGASVLGVIALFAGFKVAENQKQHVDEQQAYEESVASVEANLTRINEGFNEAIKVIDAEQFNEPTNAQIETVSEQPGIVLEADIILQQLDKSLSTAEDEARKGHRRQAHIPVTQTKPSEKGEQQVQVEKESVDKSKDIETNTTQP